MPDIENRHRRFITNIKSAARETGSSFFYRDTLDPLAESLGYSTNEKLIGAGQECVVVVDNGVPDVVVAFTYKDMDIIKAKTIYHLHGIFSTLFPYNFPRFYASFGGEYSRTVRQRITAQKKSGTPYASPIIQFPFSKVENTAVWQLGLPYSSFIDAAPFNFIVGADGGEYYLDTIDTAVIKYLVHQKITDYMDQNGFSQEDKEKVRHGFMRLANLKEKSDKGQALQSRSSRFIRNIAY